MEREPPELTLVKGAGHSAPTGPRSPSPLAAELLTLLAPAGSALPRDASVVGKLLGDRAEVEVWRSFAELENGGWVSRVMIGAVPHLVRHYEEGPGADASGAAEVTAASEGGSGARTSDDEGSRSQSQPDGDESTQFELQVAIDMETERVLLNRIWVTVGVIAFLLLTREAALLFAF
ncbi:MAG: hypothetical protein AAFQ65_15165 [Myxococcota bacterium]